MSNVVTNKQEKERKRILQEERERRERRRQKELGANGAETPEDEEETEKIEILPNRKKLQNGRSASPAVRDNVTSSITSTMNGVRAGSPPRFNGQAPGGAKDSFLNYFFGQEKGLPPGGAGQGQQNAHNPNLGRHVSQSTEPSFSQSIRRQEERQRRTPAQQSQEDDYQLGRVQRDYDYNSPFVSNPHFRHPYRG